MAVLELFHYFPSLVVTFRKQHFIQRNEWKRNISHLITYNIHQSSRWTYKDIPRNWCFVCEERLLDIIPHTTESQQLYTIVYKCIHGAAPSYLTNLCLPVATSTSRHYLRSATHGDLQVPSTRTVTYGPRSFAVSGPTIWNTLPSTLRVSATTLGQFQSGLKTILFRLAYRAWLGAFMTV